MRKLDYGIKAIDCVKLWEIGYQFRIYQNLWSEIIYVIEEKQPLKMGV